MKYKVAVTRTVHQTIDIEVEAPDRETAEKLALDEAPNRGDFAGKEKEADYEVQGSSLSLPD
jgi:hypothetical protein